ncbi:hypothetical protein H2248_011826 [Termitomyces sp. 'cryptogamus']|nr:hypothetical protein H2248_011826 [Termitomyces sp. 'cryptogamus']
MHSPSKSIVVPSLTVTTSEALNIDSIKASTSHTKDAPATTELIAPHPQLQTVQQLTLLCNLSLVAVTGKPGHELSLALSQPTPRPLGLFQSHPTSPELPPNTPSTHTNLCSPMAPTPANSDTSPANPDNLLAIPGTSPVGPISPPSPPKKPPSLSNISPDLGTCC